MARWKLAILTVILLGGASLAEPSAAEEPALVGDGMSRTPASGIVELGASLTCYLNGQEPFDIKWFTVNSEGKEIPLLTDQDMQPSIVAEDENARYRCKTDSGHYADFIVEKEDDEPENLSPFRVEKFKKSYSVVELDDLKINCKVTNRTMEVNVKEDIIIKWYQYNITGDDTSYVDMIGNCTESIQTSLNWHEVIVPKDRSSGEAHLAIYEHKEQENATLKIEDANRNTDRRAFKCVAYHRQNRSICSESAFFVRVRDRYAALWPFLGIVAEVIVVCFIIFICERRRAAAAKDEEEEEEDMANNGKPGPGNSNVRQRNKN